MLSINYIHKDGIFWLLFTVAITRNFSLFIRLDLYSTHEMSMVRFCVINISSGLSSNSCSTLIISQMFLIIH